MAIARAFGRAAACYDEHARVQLAVARSLLEMVPPELPTGPALDAGAGTAPLARELALRYPRFWVALDVSVDMLEQGRERGRLAPPPWVPVCADAQAMPFASGVFALVWSSFALQWSDSPVQALAEAARVLKPGGLLALAVPVAGTLDELRTCWAQVDAGIHVNALASAGDWRQAAVQAGLLEQHYQALSLREHYDDLAGIHVMLKGTGAHHVRRNGVGLTTPGQLRKLSQAYEKLRTPEGLPLTWQIAFLLLEKPL